MMARYLISAVEHIRQTSADSEAYIMMMRYESADALRSMGFGLTERSPTP